MKRRSKKMKMEMSQVNGAQKGIRRKELDSIKELLSKTTSKGFSELIRYTQKYPEDPYGQRLLGLELLRREDYEGAKQAFRAVIHAHGKNEYNGLVDLALAYYREKDFDNARKYYETAIQNNPYNDLTAYIYLACLERECENYYRALNLLYSALELKDDQNHPYYDLNDVKLQIARTLLLLEKYEDAKDVLQSLTAKNPQQARELAYSEAIIYKQHEQYKEAFECLEAAKKTTEKDELYYLSTLEQAKLYKQLDMLNEALNSLEELEVANVLFNGTVPFLIGIIKYYQKDYDSAHLHFQEATTSSNYNTRNYATYHYSAIKYISGNKEEAEKILANSVIREKTPFQINCIALIRMLYDQERYQDAQYYLELVRSKDQNVDENEDFRRMEILINKKQGKDLPPIKAISYLEGQLVDYTVENAINHDLNKAIRNGFSCTSSDIEALYQEVTPLLIEDNKFMISVLDEYKIPSSSITTIIGIPVENLIVKTLPGTKEIVTLAACPERLLPTVGELKQQKANQKSKSSDAINRFNARFAKFSNPQ